MSQHALSTRNRCWSLPRVSLLCTRMGKQRNHRVALLRRSETNERRLRQREELLATASQTVLLTSFLPLLRPAHLLADRVARTHLR